MERQNLNTKIETRQSSRRTFVPEEVARGLELARFPAIREAWRLNHGSLDLSLRHWHKRLARTCTRHGPIPRRSPFSPRLMKMQRLLASIAFLVGASTAATTPWSSLVVGGIVSLLPVHRFALADKFIHRQPPPTNMSGTSASFLEPNTSLTGTARPPADPNTPTVDITSSDLICGHNTLPAPGIAPVAAGSAVSHECPGV